MVRYGIFKRLVAARMGATRQENLKALPAPWLLGAEVMVVWRKLTL